MTVRMTLKPQSLAAIIATNLRAEILSDLAGALAGSLGVAPTANIDPQRRFPSMFEPIHGLASILPARGLPICRQILDCSTDARSPRRG
jgi:tartrate dehydrogenase/decarboxylase/D-malate dehydrogenase